MRDSELRIGRVLGRTYVREDKNENYVVCPPALHIWAPDGTQFTFGTEYNNSHEIIVLCNDVSTGEFATRIECHRGVVKIYGSAGTRLWSERHRAFI